MICLAMLHVRVDPVSPVSCGQGHRKHLSSCLPSFLAYPFLSGSPGFLLHRGHWSSKEGSVGFQRVYFLNTCSKLLTVTRDGVWAGGHLKATLSVRLHSSSLLQPMLPVLPVLSNTRVSTSLWLPLGWNVSILVQGCFLISWEP